MYRKTKKLVLGAMLAALVFIATYVVQIPSPMNGYVNLGDCFVLICGWLLGPWYGALAAGIGSAMTDLLAGYAYYVPGTLVIKAVVALVAGIVYRNMRKSFAGLVLGAVLGESFMVLGYLGYAWLLLGNGIAAISTIPGNMLQAAFGIVAALLLMKVVAKMKLDDLF